MTELKMKIMVKAVNIRLAGGEEMETILASYPALTEEEKAHLRDVCPNG
jgi:uncharacterized protein (DUF433 family)